MNRFALALLLALALPTAAAAQEALVRDLNPNTPSGVPGSDPRQFASAGSRATFITGGEDPAAPSYLLWATDGTAAGTRTLTVLCARTYCTEPVAIAETPGLAFYRVSDPDAGAGFFRVWRTDGTAAGTFSASPAFYGGSDFTLLPAVLGRRLLFDACEDSSASHCALWSTDGSPAGAQRLRDHLSTGALLGPDQAGRAYFSGYDPGTQESGIWTTDGTAAGTQLLHQGFPVLLAVSGARLFFTFGGDDAPDELWTSDGTRQGTRFIEKFAEPNHYFPANTTFLKPVRGGVVFVGIRLGDPHETVANLWFSDGTRQGTRKLTAFQGDASVTGLRSDQIAEAGNRIFFVASNVAGPRLWTTRGAVATTAPVTGCAGGCPAVQPDSSLAPIGSRVVFAGKDVAHGAEPWASDGTGAGTRLLSDLCLGPCNSSPEAFTLHGGKIDFRATWNGRTRLVRTDGLAAVPLAQVADDDSLQIDLADLPGGRTVFTGFDRAHGLQPWITDGTPAGTRRIAELAGAGGSSNPADFTALGDHLLFTASDGAERSVWSLGSGGGLAPLPGTGVPLSQPGPSQVTAAGGLAYFVVDRGAQTPELWRTDGTPAGTLLLAAFPDKTLGDLRDLNGTLVFLVTSTNGEQPVYSLWRSNGTPAGTVRGVDLPADTVGIDPVTALGANLYLLLHQEDGAQILRSDGTAAGTRAIFTPACDCLTPSRIFFQAGGRDLFVAATSDGLALFQTDGTPEGTARIFPAPGKLWPTSDPEFFFAFQGDLYFTGPASSVVGTLFLGLWKLHIGSEPLLLRAFDYPSNGPVDPGYAPLGNRLFFRAADAAHGLELWRTDGTVPGTLLVRDLSPGPASGDPQGLVGANGRLWFSALDPVHGRELWMSDGTRKGTRLVEDLAPGPLSSAPEELTPVNGRLYFSADDGTVGREPWSLPLGFGGR